VDTKNLKELKNTDPRLIDSAVFELASEEIVEDGDNPDELLAITRGELHTLFVQHKLIHNLLEVDHLVVTAIIDNIHDRPKVKQNTIEVKAKRELTNTAKAQVEKLMKELGGRK
jgi:hypothetical protein